MERRRIPAVSPPVLCYSAPIGKKRTTIYLGRFLTQEVSLEDRVFRIGGDEFMVYLPASDMHETIEVAGRFYRKSPGAAPVSFTLGYGVREEQESLEETIRRADQELIHIRVEERQIQTRRSPILRDGGQS
jgi:GGDEF domain-containing protein